MRLGPLFIALAGYAWVFLASVGWSLAGVLTRREPRFTTLGLGFLAAAAAVMAVTLLARRGGLALALSFPSAFLACLFASAADYRWRDRRWL